MIAAFFFAFAAASSSGSAPQNDAVPPRDATAKDLPVSAAFAAAKAKGKDMVVPAFEGNVVVGAKVVVVDKDGALAASGVQKGDLVTHVGGCAVTQERMNLLDRLGNRSSDNPSITIEGKREGAFFFLTSAALGTAPQIDASQRPVVGDRGSCAAFLHAAKPTTVPTGLVGLWTNDSCAPRKYPRTILVAADGTFEANDMVSPCPPRAQCAWSGIETTRGTWTFSAPQTLHLKPASAPARGQSSFPTTLSFTTSALLETHDGVSCSYIRK
jgi:hypothetical protein